MIRRFFLLIEAIILIVATLLVLSILAQIYMGLSGNHHHYHDPWATFWALTIGLLCYAVVYGAIRWVITGSLVPFRKIEKEDDVDP